MERILVIKNQSYSETRVFALTIECSMVGLKNWLERDLIESFWISNETVKMKELLESQPLPITHLAHLED